MPEAGAPCFPPFPILHTLLLLLASCINHNTNAFVTFILKDSNVLCNFGAPCFPPFCTTKGNRGGVGRGDSRKNKKASELIEEFYGNTLSLPRAPKPPFCRVGTPWGWEGPERLFCPTMSPSAIRINPRANACGSKLWLNQH